MHRSEAEMLAPCSACGTEVSPQDRSFAFGDDQTLCFGCAMQRNGSYDEAHDHWILEPYVADLLSKATLGN